MGSSPLRSRRPYRTRRRVRRRSGRGWHRRRAGRRGEGRSARRRRRPWPPRLWWLGREPAAAGAPWVAAGGAEEPEGEGCDGGGEEWPGKGWSTTGRWGAVDGSRLGFGHGASSRIHVKEILCGRRVRCCRRGLGRWGQPAKRARRGRKRRGTGGGCVVHLSRADGSGARPRPVPIHAQDRCCPRRSAPLFPVRTPLRAMLSTDRGGYPPPAAGYPPSPAWPVPGSHGFKMGQPVGTTHPTRTRGDTGTVIGEAVRRRSGSRGWGITTWRSPIAPRPTGGGLAYTVRGASALGRADRGGAAALPGSPPPQPPAGTSRGERVV